MLSLFDVRSAAIPAMKIVQRYKMGPLFTPPPVSKWEGPLGLLMVPSAELGMRGMGKVMGAVKTRLAGKADMGQVSAAVKAALAGA